MSDVAVNDELRLHSSLYMREAIVETCEVFEVCAEIEHLEEGAYHLIRFVPKDEADVEEIMDEFGNYALGLTIEAQRSTQ